MRTGLTTLALVGALAVGITGCMPEEPPTPTSPTSQAGGRYVPSPTDGQTLKGSVMADGLTRAITDATGYKQVTTEGSRSRDRVVQAKKVGPKRTDMRVTGGDTLETMLIDNVLYERIRHQTYYDVPHGSTPPPPPPETKIQWEERDPNAKPLNYDIGVDGRPTRMTEVLLDSLRGSEVSYAGGETKGQKYTATVPAVAYVRAAAKVEGESPEEFAEDLATVKGKNLEYEIWLDSTGRPAEISVDGSQVDPSGENAYLTVRFSNWNETYSAIKKPPEELIKGKAPSRTDPATTPSSGN